MYEIASSLPLSPRLRSRSRTMQAALWQEESCAAIATIPAPHLRENQLLIRASGYGLSLHDLRAWRRGCPALPGAPGAEGWGVVERVGCRVDGFMPGQSVAFHAARGFGEIAIVDPHSAVVLPEALQHTPFLLRSTAGVVNLFRRSQMNSGDLVVIVGGGFLGLLTAQLASLAEARTIVISRRESTRQLALQLGASAALPADEKTVARLQKLTGGELADFAIETGGAAATLQLATELTRPRGRLIIAGHHPAARAVNLPLWSERGLDVINAHEPSPTLTLECMREAVGAVAAGLITPEVLYTHRFPLERIQEALTCASRRSDDYVKALIHLSPCHPIRSPHPALHSRAY